MHQIQYKNGDDFNIENQKGIDNHKKIAAYLETASKHYNEAAKHQEAGYKERSSQSAVLAKGFFSLAIKGQREDAEHHTTYN